MAIAAIRANINMQSINRVFNKSTVAPFAGAGLLSTVMAIAGYYRSNFGFILPALLFASSAASYFNQKNITNNTRPIQRSRAQNSYEIDVNKPQLAMLQTLSHRKDVDSIQFTSGHPQPGIITDKVMKLLPQSLNSLDLLRCQPVQDLLTLVNYFPKNLRQLRVAVREFTPTSTVFQAISSTCPLLRKIDMVNQKSTTFHQMNLDGLQSLPSLELLTLTGFYVTNDQVKKLPHLKEIRMSKEIDSHETAALIKAAIMNIKMQRPNVKVCDLAGYPWQPQFVEPHHALSSAMHHVVTGVPHYSTSSLKSGYANKTELGTKSTTPSHAQASASKTPSLKSGNADKKPGSKPTSPKNAQVATGGPVQMTAQPASKYANASALLYRTTG